MVFVDQLVLTVAACIRSLAELEKELDGVVGVGMLDRLKWTVRETGIRRILEALQTHRSSLTLVLTILTALVFSLPDLPEGGGVLMIRKEGEKGG
jgi:hypothetical protein